MNVFMRFLPYEEPAFELFKEYCKKKGFNWRRELLRGINLYLDEVEKKDKRTYNQCLEEVTKRTDGKGIIKSLERRRTFYRRLLQKTRKELDKKRCTGHYKKRT